METAERAREDGLWDYRQGLSWNPASDDPEYVEAYRSGWRQGQRERAEFERGED